MDMNDVVAQELYYHYTSNLFEHFEQLHDSTILQLFYLLPYEIEEEQYLEYDLFNRAECDDIISRNAGVGVVPSTQPPPSTQPAASTQPAPSTQPSTLPLTQPSTQPSAKQTRAQKYGKLKIEFETELIEISADIQEANFELQARRKGGRDEETFTNIEIIGVLSGMVFERNERLLDIRRQLGNVKQNMKRCSAEAEPTHEIETSERCEQKAIERKTKDTVRHRQANMTPGQIVAHQERSRHTNMTPEQIVADQERHRQANMTPGQIVADQERHRHANMTTGQIFADQERHRHANITPDRILAHQERNRRPSMTPENLAAVRRRDQREFFLPVAQEWDLRHPCEK